MTELDAQQLGFILDIKKEDARAKMCVAWSKSKGEENKAQRVRSKKIDDPYPKTMPIEMLAKELNLPTLQEMVNDIQNNYLVRPASRKWILCDYPENELRKAKEAGKRRSVKIPPALRSMLPRETQDTILNEWRTRHRV